MEGEILDYTLPRPYPVVSKAAGNYVCGDGEIIPASDWLRLSKSEDDEVIASGKDLYDFALTFCTPEDVGDHTAGEYADAMLELLNLPKLKDLATNKETVRGAFYSVTARPDSEYRAEMQIEREHFEGFYQLIASSTYIQLAQEPHMGYIISEPAPDDYYDFLGYFYAAFPWESLGPEPTVPIMRPLVKYNLDVFGVVTYHPFSVIAFDDEQFAATQLE